MKKIFAALSSVASFLLAASVYANPYSAPQYCQAEHHPYAYQGNCAAPCVEECTPMGHFYVGGFGGANWLNFERIEGIHPKTKLGYMGALSLGYKFNSGFRVEVEGAYRRNEIKDFSRTPYVSYDNSTIKGHTSSWTAMANALYDFDQFSCYIPKVVPYVGLGAGYIEAHTHVKGQSDVYGKERAKITDRGFAGQGIAGVKYRLTDKTSIGIEYRYLLARVHAHEQNVGISLTQAF